MRLDRVGSGRVGSGVVGSGWAWPGRVGLGRAWSGWVGLGWAGHGRVGLVKYRFSAKIAGYMLYAIFIYRGTTYVVAFQEYAII